MIQSEIGPRWIFSLKPSLKRVFPKHRTRRSCLGLSWICLGKGHAFLVSWISLLAVATSVRNLKFLMDVSWASLLCVSWACLGAVLDLSRAILGLSWTVLGQSWSCLSRAVLGYLGLCSGCLEPLARDRALRPGAGVRRQRPRPNGDQLLKR